MSSNPDYEPVAGATEPSAAPAGESAPLTEVERLAAELGEAQNQLKDARDAQLRAVAEMENIRKRAQRDVEAAHRFAVERFAADLLDVRDSLELGIAASGSTAEPGGLVEGMAATLRLIDKAFEKAGIELIHPPGQPFNPEFHEAMATQPTAGQPPGTVLAVVQKGFKLSGRLLRPARVVISRAPDPAT